MPAIPRFLTEVVAKALFRSVVVASNIPLSRRFRLIELEGEELKNVRWTPGDKIQVNLGDLVCRTYTPIDWDAVEGRIRFVVFLHGSGLGSEWASSVQSGTSCEILGPRASLKFKADAGPTVLFGDETSIGAALAHQQSRPYDSRNQYLFEVRSSAESMAVARRLNFKGGTFITKAEDAGHIVEIEERMFEARMRMPSTRLRTAHWMFTGNAYSIQRVKGALRRNGFVPAHSSTHAFWAHGKTGLD